jgi:colanic acid biosynthesis glycosyl transferase WcaI
MRILVVTQYFWPESFRINDLALGLEQRGHQVTVLTGMPNYPGGQLYSGYRMMAPSSEQYEGIAVKRVPIIPRGGRRNWQLALNYASFIISAGLLGPLRCRGDFDVIFVYEPSPITVALPGLVLKMFKRAPMLLWVQDLWPESLSATGVVQSRWILRLVRRLVDFIYRHSESVLISSKGFKSHVSASGLANQRIAHVPNWAESLYRPLDSPPAAIRAELPSGFKVMFAGNIGAAQSFGTILAAADKLRGWRDIQWVILGDGHLKTWVEDQVHQRALENHFHLLGPRPLETMPGYMSAADVLLVTLRANPVFALTVPSKVQSYLACGKPIIASINGEGAEIVIESGGGLACPAEDPEQLAETVISMYKMSSVERQHMGRNGRNYFELNFERELVIDKIEKLMQSSIQDYKCAF